MRYSDLIHIRTEPNGFGKLATDSSMVSSYISWVVRRISGQKLKEQPGVLSIQRIPKSSLLLFQFEWSEHVDSFWVFDTCPHIISYKKLVFIPRFYPSLFLSSLPFICNVDVIPPTLVLSFVQFDQWDGSTWPGNLRIKARDSLTYPPLVRVCVGGGGGGGQGVQSKNTNKLSK